MPKKYPNLFKRGNTYYYRSQHNGRVVWRSLRTSDLKLAISLANKVASDLEYEKHYGFKRERIKFRDFALGEFSTYQASRVKRWHDHDRTRVERVSEWFGECAIHEVKSVDIENRLIALVNAGRKPSTVNNYLSLLRHMFSVSKRRGYISNNPGSDVKMRKVHERPERELLPEEEKGLFGALEFPFCKIAKLALHTGMRQAEILGLLQRDVNLTAKKVQIVEAKNGHPRIVPLNDTAVAIIREMIAGRTADDDLVFTGIMGEAIHGSAMQFRWRSAVARAGIPPIRFHDLRHTFTSRLLRKGVKPRAVMKLTGHRSAEIFMRYAHESDSTAAEAVHLLDCPEEIQNEPMSPKAQDGEGKRIPGSNVIPGGEEPHEGTTAPMQ